MNKWLLVCASILLLSGSVVAQVPYLQQYHLLRKNEPVQINAMLQTRSGLMWFGTTKGMFKFDGIKFHRFTTADSLSDNNVTALAEDSLGRIWVGQKNGAISICNGRTITKFVTQEGDPTASISKILFDGKGNVWFSTLNDGLYYYSGNRLFRIDEEEGLPDLYVYDIIQDREGNIWAGTDAGIAVCSLNGKKVSISVIDQHSGLPDHIVKKLISAEQGIWLATEDAGLVYYDLKRKSFQFLMQNWTFGAIADFLIEEDNVWIATAQKGLIAYNRALQSLRLYDASARVPASLTTLLKDSENNIWIGARSALFRTPGDAIQFIESFSPAKDPNVLAVTPDKQGRLWFSNSEGLFTYEIDETNQAVIVPRLDNTPYNKSTIISLYCDADGYIWGGLYGEGVLRINPHTGRVLLISKELRNGNVLSITGKGNTIWLATLGGSSKIETKGDKFTVANYSTEDGLASDFTYQVFIDSKERVWFATDGRGAGMMDENGFHHFDQGLPSKVIYGFAEDGHQQLWVNVQGNRPHIFDGQKFSPISSDIVIRDNNIQSIAPDKNGNIVVFHDLGMDVIDPEHKNVRHIGDEGGLRNKIVTLNGCVRDSLGNLFYASSGGIIRYSGKDDFVSSAPKPSILSVQIFDKYLEAKNNIALAYDENNVTMRYLGLWYQNPEGVFYQYKLENFDVDWIATHEHAVTYSQLPPGKYLFRLRVSASESFDHAAETSLSFVIHPPFWRTTTFYVFCGVAFMLLGFAFIKFRERKLRYDKFVLEMKVRRRTLEIQRQKEEIQAQNEEILAQAEEINGINENLEMIVRQRTAELERKNKALEDYAFINAHKLRSPLASILGLVHLMLKTDLSEEGREIGKHLQQSADELDDVVHSITKTIERADNDYPVGKE